MNQCVGHCRSQFERGGGRAGHVGHVGGRVGCVGRICDGAMCVGGWAGWAGCMGGWAGCVVGSKTCPTGKTHH